MGAIVESCSSLLFDGSPLRVSAQRIFNVGKEQGTSVRKVMPCLETSPSPGASYVSYNRHIVGRGKLHQQEKYEQVITAISFEELEDSDGKTVQSFSQEKEELQKQVSDLKEEVIKLQKREETGTSGLILVYDCIKHLETDLTKLYRNEMRSCSEDIIRSLGFIIKSFQRKFPDPMLSKTTGEEGAVFKKVGFITFAAALWHFICHHETYGKEELEAKHVIKAVVKVYKVSVGLFVDSLMEGGDAELMHRLATSVSSLSEWYALYKLRRTRDHIGGHCATWREQTDPKEEAERLRNVEAIFGQLLEENYIWLQKFPILGKCAAINLKRYISDKEKQSRPTAISQCEEGLTAWALQL